MRMFQVQGQGRYACCACTVLCARTLSSPQSGGTNSMMFFTVAAAQSTCGSRGSPHAVRHKGSYKLATKGTKG